MEPASLGRVAFDAWLARGVVEYLGGGRYRLLRAEPSTYATRWRTLSRLDRETWEAIGQAVADHLEEPTYLIEVDPAL